MNTRQIMAHFEMKPLPRVMEEFLDNEHEIVRKRLFFRLHVMRMEESIDRGGVNLQDEYKVALREYKRISELTHAINSTKFTAEELKELKGD